MHTKVQLPEGVPPLTAYYMYLTRGCNLACRHCWLAPTFQKNGGTGGHLVYDLYTLAIEEALPLGLTRIKFTGGEPLLHPDFVRMMDYATEKELRTSLETNGTLLTRDLARYLKEKTSLYSIAVSLDGATASTHDYMRNVPGSFDLARKGISCLVEAGYRPQVIMSLYRGNVEEIELLAYWAVEIGCSSVKFNIIQSSGRGEHMKEAEDLLTIEELIRLGGWIEKDLRNRISIPLLYSWPIAFHGIKRLQDGPEGMCHIHHILGVLSTGHLAMCGIGTQEKDLIYGRLGMDSVFEIWTSNALLVRLREIIPGQLEGICSQCIIKNRCLGYCIAQNYHASRRLTAPFWFCQLAYEAGLFPLSRLHAPRNFTAQTVSKLAV